MRRAVQQAFSEFNEPFEGRVNFMYCDVKGLVTTGMGNLIDPLPVALTLPWLKPDMSRASWAEIREEWLRVKAAQDIRMQGGGAYRKLTSLRLSEGAIDTLILLKVNQMATYLQGRCPDFVDWPADAQLAVLSMAWALGPAFSFPAFWACAKKRDFIGAANESHIIGSGTVVKRNLANKLLFVNAARVLEQNLDPSVLYWPKLLPPTQTH